VLLKAAKVYGDEAKAAKLSGGCRPQASWRQRRGRRSGASARYCVVENVWARRPFDGHPSRRPFHLQPAPFHTPCRTHAPNQMQSIPHHPSSDDVEFADFAAAFNKASQLAAAGGQDGANCLGWAARDTSAVLAPYKFVRRELGPKDVFLKITHAGG
jgi:hypothetical protein